MSKLDEVIEDTMVGTANKYGSGGMYSELEQDEIDEIKNPAKAAIKALVLELIPKDKEAFKWLTEPGGGAIPIADQQLISFVLSETRQRFEAL